MNALLRLCHKGSDAELVAAVRAQLPELLNELAMLRSSKCIIIPGQTRCDFLTEAIRMNQHAGQTLITAATWLGALERIAAGDHGGDPEGLARRTIAGKR